MLCVKSISNGSEHQQYNPMHIYVFTYDTRIETLNELAIPTDQR
uniref:Uncharacterized protein n=1 Tax=Picea sitchensis TaxID=3332 RepID=A0A6B9XSH0_PICSI|nr:hypothetical protein Q903MT_gene3980 [Picea sitchensis]